VQFGIFDHLTRLPGVELEALYEGRIALLQKAERAGFYGYHLAEHHGHSLSTTPSQALFLATLARETERLRLGMLVVCLPLHHPIRITEEICMLDQLSGGRLDLGVGRGISPFEHSLFGHHPDEGRERFEETLAMVVQGLETGRIDSTRSRHYDFPEVELPVEPKQRPYPPMWAAGNVEFAGRNGCNFIFGGPVTEAIRSRYDELREESRRQPGHLNPHVAEPKIGSSQYVCIADTDEEACRIGRRALGVLARLLKRSVETVPPHLQDANKPGPTTPLVEAIERGGPDVLVCGSPRTVGDHFVRYAAEGHANYTVINVPFGDMTIEEADRTLDLFIDGVMPAVGGAASA
jgi:alkanesulfonate monooxygenase SsuD/methylene tetrahydromethanopterin reductase-like flavin-dependent oxidoreductase (luciferase family)